MALLDNTKEGLQGTTDLLHNYIAYAGLEINAGKTQSILSARSSANNTFDITFSRSLHPTGQ